MLFFNLDFSVASTGNFSADAIDDAWLEQSFCQVQQQRFEYLIKVPNSLNVFQFLRNKKVWNFYFGISRNILVTTFRTETFMYLFI